MENFFQFVSFRDFRELINDVAFKQKVTELE